jgi:hypothetical protein
MNKPNKKQDLNNDLQFIVDECFRFKNTLQKISIKYFKDEDFNYTLSDTIGADSSIICGRSAAMKIIALSEEAAQRRNLTQRIKLQKIRIEIARLIAERFIKEGRTIDTKQLDRLLSSAAKAAQKHCLTVTHHIPCHLISADDPDSFSFGPVTFHNRHSYFQLLKDSKKEASNFDRTHDVHARSLLAKTLKYYRNFRWVAVVTITNCDPDISARLANESVTSALNCLHMIFGVRNTGRMRIGGLNLPADRRAKLTQTSDGKLEPSLSTAWFGELRFTKGWSEVMEKPDFKHWQTLCAVVLESAVDPDLQRPLSRRFLDALQWFGEACRDDSPATRTVKYVTAIERLLMTDEHDDVTSIVAERLAVLCFNVDNPRDAWKKKTKEVYNLRSRLVHGSISPGAIEVIRGVNVAASITEAVLPRALEVFTVEGLQDEKMTSKQVSEWFGRVLRWANTTETSQKSN